MYFLGISPSSALSVNKADFGDAHKTIFESQFWCRMMSTSILVIILVWADEYHIKSPIGLEHYISLVPLAFRMKG